jgi:hypothetical protein
VISPLLANIYLTEVDAMLERAKEVTRDGGWARVEYARYADDLVTLVDGYRRHAWLRVAEVAIASPSPAGAWILRNAETGDVNFREPAGHARTGGPAVPAAPASDNGRLRHGAAVPARGGAPASRAPPESVHVDYPPPPASWLVDRQI